MLYDDDDYSVQKPPSETSSILNFFDKKKIEPVKKVDNNIETPEKPSYPVKKIKYPQYMHSKMVQQYILRMTSYIRIFLLLMKLRCL